MEFERIIRDVLKDEFVSCKLISDTNNKVFKVLLRNGEYVYAKFYLNRSTHIDHELRVYDYLDNSLLKDVLYRGENMAIYKELKGKLLDELTDEEIESNKGKVIDSLITFYESIGKVKVEGYGLLDKDLHGTSTSFIDFLKRRQGDTVNELSGYEDINYVTEEIFKKYEGILVADNSLVPIDTNMKNIMILETGEVKFIDPGEMISAPKLMGYGDFVAHAYKTPLYDELRSKLNLSNDEEKLLHIYAVFSSLNILAFLHRNKEENLSSIIPFGNKDTFFNLISDHLKCLGISSSKLLLKK